MPDRPAHVHAITADAVKGWLAGISGRRVVAIDTETTGWDPHIDDLLSVQVAVGGDHPVLVLDATRVHPRLLAPLCADASVLKVFHHAVFDLRFLAVAGVETVRVADTMIAQQLLDGGQRSPAGISLAGLASFRLGAELDKSVRSTFGPHVDTLTTSQVAYAADDAWATWGVFDQQWRELIAHGLTRVAQLEFSLLPVLADMQLRGVSFDAPRWLGMLGQLEGELPALDQAVQDALVTEESPRDLFGVTPVNLDSHEQVREALARMGIDVESTREHVLRDHDAHPAVAAFLRWRQLHKVTSNWGGDWAERVRHPRTGRIHADWRQIVGTGRLACSDPNMTQVPREDRFRACFGGGRGRAHIVADYSQQELRILASVSGDEALIEVFRSGGDLHRATAATVFDCAESSVSPEQRASAKQLNFGLMYGMGAAGFARATGQTVTEARTTMNRYFGAFPRVARWLAVTESAARREGAVRTPFGRVRHLSPDERGTVTLARNAPIQGAGADMTKLAMIEVERRFAQRFGGRGGRTVRGDGLVLVVHDELVAEVDLADAEEAADLVREGMLAAASSMLGAVPAVVDLEIRPRWGRLDGRD